LIASSEFYTLGEMNDPTIFVSGSYHPPGVVPMAPPEPGVSMRAVLPPPDESTYRSVLLGQGYTLGLIRAMQISRSSFAHTYWVVDNSGSMQTVDGHRIVETMKTGLLNFVECSRWKELVETADYNANLAALVHIPTTFRLLNHPGIAAGPQIFSIATNHSIDHDLAVAVNTLQNSEPSGVTPLTDHVRAIREEILGFLPELNGQKVAVVLATDGTPTDSRGNSGAAVQQQFKQSLRELLELPVWLVVRLCTDEGAVVEYWNGLDEELERNMEVLDDFVSEGHEVYEKNPWITYGLPLHRMREMGFHSRVFDMIDERTLSKDQVRDFLLLLFGTFEAPDPGDDWKGFCNVVERLLSREKKIYNPVLKKLIPWIDMKKLRQIDGSGRWFGIF
jgi:hypothetical protein